MAAGCGSGPARLSGAAAGAAGHEVPVGCLEHPEAPGPSGPFPPECAAGLGEVVLAVSPQVGPVSGLPAALLPARRLDTERGVREFGEATQGYAS